MLGFVGSEDDRERDHHDDHDNDPAAAAFRRGLVDIDVAKMTTRLSHGVASLLDERPTIGALSESGSLTPPHSRRGDKAAKKKRPAEAGRIEICSAIDHINRMAMVAPPSMMVVPTVARLRKRMARNVVPPQIT